MRIFVSLVLMVISFFFGVFIQREIIDLSKIYYYESSSELSVTDFHGVELCRFPAGVKFFATQRTSPVGEHGYWAGIPLYFGLSSEAHSMLSPASSEKNEFDNIIYNVIPSKDLKFQ